MSNVYLPLFGPDDPKGRSPKGVAASGWQLPGYKGVEPTVDGRWYGLRLDDYIVVDCDDEAAKDAWLSHVDMSIDHTMVRKTPHGWHFYYRRTIDVLHVRPQVLRSVSPKIDLKAGIGHQVVCLAPGYRTISPPGQDAGRFLASWVPAQQEVQIHEEWSEMPEGIGDNSMISFAGTFRRWGMDQKTILKCLSAINASTMTNDPMPHSSLRRIARQAAKYSPEEAKSVLCPSCGNEVEYR